jgi:hypothetical protein
MSRISNSIKKVLQDKIVERNFQLDEFEYSSPSPHVYVIKYKQDYFKFQLTLINQNPNAPVDLAYFDVNSTKQKSWMGAWGGAYKVYESWLNNILQEKTHVPFELQEQDKDFSPLISNISSQFSIIYNQALKAEHFLLNEVCGMGYRKAFEFLLKDYLIYVGKMTLEQAQKEYRLKVCIDLLEDDDLFRRLATYTAHLGNDFSHYYRKMADKEIADLKTLINTLVDWIDAREGHKLQLQALNERSQGIISKFEKKLD